MSNSFSRHQAGCTDAPRSPIWTDAVKVIRQLIAWLKQKRVVRRDLKRLMELDDRELADIGLNRGDLLDAVRHGRPSARE